MRSALDFLITSQAAGDMIFGLFLLISLLVMWWIIRVGKPFFDLYPLLARILLWAIAALLTDSLLMLLMLQIPVPTILRLGARGWFLLDAENQAIQLCLILDLPCLAGILVISSFLIARQLLRERRARRRQRSRS